jgi:transcriptional regulator with XRE-family HTH domain
MVRVSQRIVPKTPSPGKPSERSKDWKIELGNRLRLRGRKLGFSGAEVARRAGLTDKQYSNYLTGARAPDGRTLRKISIALDTTMDELMNSDALLHQDENTYKAGRRFLDAIENLTAQDIRLIADFAEFVQFDRRDEHRSRFHLTPGVSALALAHELLIPSIIRNLNARGVGTAIEVKKGQLILQVFAFFRPSDDVAALKKACLALAKERLHLSMDKLSLSQTEQPTTLGPAVIFTAKLGPVSYASSAGDPATE